MQEALCQECKLHEKDTIHALWTCPALVDNWKPQFECLMSTSGNCSCFLDIIYLASMDKVNFGLFAMTVSMIWMTRNKAWVGEATFPLSSILSKAKDSV